MLRITIYSILLIAALLYIAETRISFSPFKIQFARGWMVLGFILIGIGVGLVGYQGYKEGERKGMDATFKFLNQIIKKQEGK